MNHEETRRFLTILVSEFSGGKPLTDQDFSMRVDTWQMMFRNESAAIMQDALIKIIETRKNAFMPTVAEVKDVVNMCKQPELALMIPEDAFTRVRRVILDTSQYDLYRADRDPETCDQRLRNSLSDIEYEAVRMVGGHMRFRMVDDSQNEFLRNSFVRTIKTLQERKLADQFAPNYILHPSLLEMSEAAERAEIEDGVDTTELRTNLRGFLKDRQPFITPEKMRQYREQERERRGEA